MADIRRTDVIDDFIRANELYPPGILSPWLKLAIATRNAELKSNQLYGTDVPSANTAAYYSALHWSGRVGEIWAFGGGSSALSDYWRMSLFSDPDNASLTCGYSLLVGQGVGGNSWTLRRYDNGSFTTLAFSEGSYPVLQNRYCMLRLNGTHVEAWYSTNTSDPSAWTKAFDVVDNTYSGPFYPSLGHTGLETTWDWVGGTPLDLFTPQIIRSPARPRKTTRPDPHRF